ncbi:MAG: sugar phosphate isomerase/epimerase [Verrucomicrobia bacterium]|nr:sugar phosphate isomerase/epimerase [Verrucomicrobiota bacterium]
MELGIFAKTFRRPDLQATLEAVQALDLRSVQFNFECAGLSSLPDAVPAAVLAAMTAESCATGIRFAAISGTFNMAHPEREAREQGLRRLRVVIEAAAQLAVPRVTLCTGTRDPNNMWQDHRDNRSDQAWADLLSTIEPALDSAAEFGVALAIEPEHSNVVCNATRARKLLDTLQVGGQLQVILDPANLLEKTRPQSDVLREAFDLLGADLGIAHAKDCLPSGAVCALGRGTVDFDAYFKWLRTISFQGPIIMHGFSEAEAAESTSFARAKLKKHCTEDAVS